MSTMSEWKATSEWWKLEVDGETRTLIHLPSTILLQDGVLLVKTDEQNIEADDLIVISAGGQDVKGKVIESDKVYENLKHHYVLKLTVEYDNGKADIRELRREWHRFSTGEEPNEEWYDRP